MENVKELIKDIKDNLSQVNSSQKDEVRVMRAMLNDKDYIVDVYGKNGVEGTVSPFEESRSMIASVINSTTSMPIAEARVVADKHEFSKNESSSMVNISKEFINSYIETGRKLPFGGREKFDIAISGKEVKENIKTYPAKIGFSENGDPIWGKGEKKIKAHTSAKVYASCPSWV